MVDGDILKTLQCRLETMKSQVNCMYSDISLVCGSRRVLRIFHVPSVPIVENMITDHRIPMEPIFGSGSAHFGITSGAVPLRRKNRSYLFGVVWRVKSWNWCPINFCLQLVPCIQLIVQPDFKHLGSDMVETCVGTPNKNSFWQKNETQSVIISYNIPFLVSQIP